MPVLDKVVDEPGRSSMHSMQSFTNRQRSGRRASLGTNLGLDSPTTQRRQSTTVNGSSLPRSVIESSRSSLVPSVLSDTEVLNRWRVIGVGSDVQADEQLHRLQILSRYVPRAVSLRILVTGKHVTGSSLSTDAVRNRFFGVVLLSDISGFTQLAADLAKGLRNEGVGQPGTVPARGQPSSTSDVKPSTPGSTTANATSEAADTFKGKTMAPATTSASASGVLQKTGGERLASILNTVFSRFIDIVRKYGGDVTKFAGDALLSVFRPRSDDPADLLECGLKAARAALDMQEGMATLKALGINLDLHSGISAGMLHELHFGGIEHRWEYMFAGQPIVEMGRALESAVRGEVVMQSSVYELIKGHCQVAVRDDDLFLLTSVDTPVSPVLDSVPDLMQFLSRSRNCRPIELALACYLPRSVILALNAGKQGLIGERRQVTMVFINLPDFHYDTDQQIQSNQKAFRSIQQALHRFDGTLRQLIQDDKGTVAIAAFGLPYNSHDDDPVRAIQASLTIQSELGDMGMRTGIGITTGGAFCGSVGDETRCEYAIVGDIVNLSARLMVASHNGLLCDGETQRAAYSRGRSQWIDFEKMEPIKVKGRLGIVQIFRPIPSVPQQSLERPSTLMLGRATEMAIAKQMFVQLHCDKPDPNRKSVLLIEGEAGMGKTRLVQGIWEIAQDFHCDIFHFAANRMSDGVPLIMWNAILAPLILSCCPPDTDSKLPIASMLEVMAGKERLTARDVEEIIGIGASTSRVASATGRHTGRAKKALYGSSKSSSGKSKYSSGSGYGDQRPRSRALLHLLRVVIEMHGPICLIVENLRNLDPLSAFHLNYICCRLPPKMVVILTSRPLPPVNSPASLVAANADSSPSTNGKKNAEAMTIALAAPSNGTHSELSSVQEKTSRAQKDFRSLPYFVRVKLGPLSRRDIEALLCLRLHMTQLPESLLDTVHKSSEGNPYLVVALASGLLEANISPHRFTETAHEIVQYMLEQIITSRLDSLTPSQQEVLKCASVIGVVFPLELLQAISPYDDERLLENLAQLEANDFIVTTATVPKVTYAFRQPLMKGIVYELLSAADSSVYHNLIVDRLERQQQDMLLVGRLETIPATSADLAGHFERAGRLHNAIQYYRLAGDAAFSLGDFATASLNSGKGLALLQRFSPNDRFEIAKLQRSVAKSYFENFELQMCRPLVESAIRNLGGYVPDSDHRCCSMVSSMSGDFSSCMVLRRMVMNNAKRMSSGDTITPRLLERAKAYNLLSHIAIEMGDGRLVVDTAILAIRSADLAGSFEQRVLAMAHMMMGGLTEGRRHACRRFFRRTLARLDDDRNSAGNAPFSMFVKGYIWMRLASVSCAVYGDIDRALEYLRNASDLFTTVNSPHHSVRALDQLAGIYLTWGRVNDVKDVVQRMYQISEWCSFRWGQSRASILLALARLLNGETRATAEVLGGISESDLIDDIRSRVQWRACRMASDWYEGRRDEALSHATVIAGLAHGVAYDALSAIAWMAQVTILHYRELAYNVSDKEVRQGLDLAVTCVRTFRELADRVPLAKPRYLLINGLLTITRDPTRIKQATSDWVQALGLAVSFRLPYEEAMAHRLIGTLGRPDLGSKAKTLAAQSSTPPAPKADIVPGTAGDSMASSHMQQYAALIRQHGFAMLLLPLLKERIVGEVESEGDTNDRTATKRDMRLLGYRQANLSSLGDIIDEAALQLLYDEVGHGAAGSAPSPSGRNARVRFSSLANVEFFSKHPLSKGTSSPSTESLQTKESTVNETPPTSSPDTPDLDRVPSTPIEHTLIIGLDAENELVGREQHVEALQEAFRRDTGVSVQHCPVVLFGEPGVGKSALARRFVHLVTTENQTIRAFVMYGELSYKQQPYLPVIRLVRKMIGEYGRTLGVMSVFTIMDILFNRIPHYNKFREVMMHVIYSSDGVQQPALRQMSEVARAQVLAHVFNELIRGVSQAFPFCLVCEDIQWFDSGTWHVLGCMAANPIAGAFIICTLQTIAETGEFARAALPEGNFYLPVATTQWLRVEPLRRQSLSLFACCVLRATHLTTRLEILLMDKTRGNPLAALQVMTAINEAGLMAVQGGSVDLTADVVDVLFAISGSSADLTLRRTSFLSTNQIKLLRLASVIGVSFPLNVLRMLSTQYMDTRLFKAELSRLSQLGWLLLANMRSSSPRVSFPHSSTRDDVYNTMPDPIRRRLHVAVAEYYESGSTSSAYMFSQVAKHYRLGQVFSLDRKFSLLAGEQFMYLFMKAEALDILSHVVESGGESSSQVGEHSRVMRAQLLARLAYVHMQAEEWPEAQRLLTVALTCVNDSAASISASALGLSIRLGVGHLLLCSPASCCARYRRSPHEPSKVSGSHDSAKKVDVSVAPCKLPTSAPAGGVVGFDLVVDGLHAALRDSMSRTERELGNLERALLFAIRALLSSPPLSALPSADILALRYSWLILLISELGYDNGALLNMACVLAKRCIRVSRQPRTLAESLDLIWQAASAFGYWRTAVNIAGLTQQFYREDLFDVPVTIRIGQHLGIMHMFLGDVKAAAVALGEATFLAAKVHFLDSPTLSASRLLEALVLIGTVDFEAPVGEAPTNARAPSTVSSDGEAGGQATTGASAALLTSAPKMSVIESMAKKLVYPAVSRAGVERLLADPQKPASSSDAAVLLASLDAQVAMRTGAFGRAYTTSVSLRKRVHGISRLQVVLGALTAAEVLVNLAVQGRFDHNKRGSVSVSNDRERRDNGENDELLAAIGCGTWRTLLSQADTAVHELYLISSRAPFCRAHFLLWHAALLWCKGLAWIDVAHMLNAADDAAIEFNLPGTRGVINFFMAHVLTEKSTSQSRPRRHARLALSLCNDHYYLARLRRRFQNIDNDPHIEEEAKDGDLSSRSLARRRNEDRMMSMARIIRDRWPVVLDQMAVNADSEVDLPEVSKLTQMPHPLAGNTGLTFANVEDGFAASGDDESVSNEDLLRQPSLNSVSASAPNLGRMRSIPEHRDPPSTSTEPPAPMTPFSSSSSESGDDDQEPAPTEAEDDNEQVPEALSGADGEPKQNADVESKQSALSRVKTFTRGETLSPSTAAPSVSRTPYSSVTRLPTTIYTIGSTLLGSLASVTQQSLPPPICATPSDSAWASILPRPIAYGSICSTGSADVCLPISSTTNTVTPSLTTSNASNLKSKAIAASLEPVTSWAVVLRVCIPDRLASVSKQSSRGEYAAVFAVLLDCVERFRGAVLELTDQHLLAVWDACATSSQASLCSKAMLCALAMRHALQERTFKDRFDFRWLMACDDIVFVNTRGVNAMRGFIGIGPAVNDVHLWSDEGKIVVHKDMLKLLRLCGRVDVRREGDDRIYAVVHGFQPSNASDDGVVQDGGAQTLISLIRQYQVLKTASFVAAPFVRLPTRRHAPGVIVPPNGDSSQHNHRLLQRSGNTAMGTTPNVSGMSAPITSGNDLLQINLPGQVGSSASSFESVALSPGSVFASSASDDPALDLIVIAVRVELPQQDPLKACRFIDVLSFELQTMRFSEPHCLHISLSSSGLHLSALVAVDAAAELGPPVAFMFALRLSRLIGSACNVGIGSGPGWLYTVSALEDTVAIGPAVRHAQIALSIAKSNIVIDENTQDAFEKSIITHEYDEAAMAAAEATNTSVPLGASRLAQQGKLDAQQMQQQQQQQQQQPPSAGGHTSTTATAAAAASIQLRVYFVLDAVELACVRRLQSLSRSVLYVGRYDLRSRLQNMVVSRLDMNHGLLVQIRSHTGGLSGLLRNLVQVTPALLACSHRPAFLLTYLPPAGNALPPGTAIRHLVKQFFKPVAAAAGGGAALRAKVMSTTNRMAPRLARDLWLLNPLLDIDGDGFPAPPASDATMSPRAPDSSTNGHRAAQLLSIVVGMLLPPGRRLILVVDRAERLDPWSAICIDELVGHAPSTFAILGYNESAPEARRVPIGQSATSPASLIATLDTRVMHGEEFLSNCARESLLLPALSTEETALLVSLSLGGFLPSPEFLSFVSVSAGGHPNRIIAIARASYVVCERARRMRERTARDSNIRMDRVMTDQLTKPQRDVLAVCSVIGMRFEYRTLQAVLRLLNANPELNVDGATYPEEDADLDRELDAFLTKARLMVDATPPGSDMRQVAFASEAVLNSVASTVDIERKRRLHGVVASVLEELGAENDNQLAHHWRMARNYARCIMYQVRVGRSQRRDGAISKAIAAYRAAIAGSLSLSRQPSPAAGTDAFAAAPPITPVAVDAINVELAECYMLIEEYALAVDSLKNALLHLGRPVPMSHGLSVSTARARHWIRSLFKVHERPSGAVSTHHNRASVVSSAMSGVGGDDDLQQHRLMPPSTGMAPASSNAELIAIIRIYLLIAWNSVMVNNANEGFDAAMKAVDAAQALPVSSDPASEAMAAAADATISEYYLWHGWTDMAYSSAGRASRRAAAPTSPVTDLVTLYGAILDIASGNFALAEPKLKHCAVGRMLYEEPLLGYRLLLSQAVLAILQEDFVQARSSLTTLDRACTQYGSVVMHRHIATLNAFMALQYNELETCRTLLLGEYRGEVELSITGQGILCLVYLRLGQTSKASAWFGTLFLDYSTRTDIARWDDILQHVLIAEYLDFASRYAFARGIADLYAGCLELLESLSNGSASPSIGTLQRAIGVLELTDLRFFDARARFIIGSHCGFRDPRDHQMLISARQYFSVLLNSHYLNLVDEALQRLPLTDLFSKSSARRERIMSDAVNEVVLGAFTKRPSVPDGRPPQE
ncbi:hypothetical protein PBRA_001450 [Plasmodiophora brassicae]|uniref:Guanylate cyclase domain-containing protein n=1 Tax=Plasmodiophora brassicae TaxID=37360 RepID=A0A0G4IZA4_PLABS|nr:hypothetical protein PBRA_001450 [Plasmodiophora brassicae]